METVMLMSMCVCVFVLCLDVVVGMVWIDWLMCCISLWLSLSVSACARAICQLSLLHYRANSFVEMPIV